MDYQSRRYALLNTPIEVDRHLGRVHRFLQPRADDRLLEVGCGRGFLTRQVQRFVPGTIGVDLNPEAVEHNVATGARVMNAQALDFPDASFDKIYSFHVIEHLPDLGAALAEMNRVLKPGGSVLLVYPAEPIRGLYVIPTAMRLYGNPWRARDLHIHKLSARALRPHLAATSLQMVHHELQWLLTPQFITVLWKRAAAAA
jgi:ubiquinone/menaquinone biosynthesis C-methylase UbiE